LVVRVRPSARFKALLATRAPTRPIRAAVCCRADAICWTRGADVLARWLSVPLKRAVIAWSPVFSARL
jgi:hypothetical protein